MHTGTKEGRNQRNSLGFDEHEKGRDNVKNLSKIESEKTQYSASSKEEAKERVKNGYLDRAMFGSPKKEKQNKSYIRENK